MKTSLLLVLVTGMFLVLTAGSCLRGKHIVGSKNYISKEVKADHFNEIKLVGSANISYWQDTCSHVEIHGSDNIIPLIETYVEGSTFIIKFKKNVTIWKGKLEIKVFAPELNKLSVNGSGNIRLINGIQTSKDIEFHINGSGNIQGEGFNCQKMAVSINGSGDVRLQQIESQECQASIGSVVILGGLSLVNSLHAYTFASLKRKKLISTTPLNDALNALILALNASAAAFVLLFTKKFRILS